MMNRKLSFNLSAILTALTRAIILAVSAYVVLYFFLYYGIIIETVTTTWHYNDFGKLFYDLQNWRESGVLYDNTPSMYLKRSDGTMGVYRNLNPPHSLFVMFPLAWMSAGDAYAAWVVLSAAALAWSVLAVTSVLQLRLSMHQRIALGALVFSSTPVAAFVVTGHLSLVLLPVVTLLWFFMKRQRWAAAGVCLGILASIKIFFGVFFLAALLQRRWRMFGAALTAMVVYALLGVGVFGLENYYRWTAELSGVSWASGPINASLRGVVERIWMVNPETQPFGSWPGLVVPVWLTLAIAICAVTASVIKKGDHPHEFELLMLVALLLSPLGQIYYAVWLMPGLVGIWKVRGWGWAGWIPAVLLWIPLWFLRWGQPSPIATLTIGSAYAWGLLGLWALFVALRNPSPRTVRVTACDRVANSGSTLSAAGA